MSSGCEVMLGVKEGTRSQLESSNKVLDGVLLFPLQVLHSQSRHVEVRMACIHYLRENREKFEAVICNFKHVMVC